MEFMVVLVVIGVIVYLISKAGSKKVTKPKWGENYTCSDCGTAMPHNKRTIAAWEKGVRNFYCRSCHGKWREEVANKQASGCLSVLILIVVPPAIIFIGICVL